MVSVIIPCYNCEQYIKRAVESVLSQTYYNYEILLINNNSTDNSVSLLNNYVNKYPHLIRLFHESKGGAPAARNKGLSQAKGDWVQYLDADDELMPDKIERQIGILMQYNADIIAGCFIEIKNNQGRFKQTVIMPDSRDTWLSLISSSLGRTSSNLWKKKKLLEINGWNEALSSSQEYDLLFRALKKEAIICFDTKPSTFIHFTANSISKSINEKRNSEIFDNWLNLRLSIKNYLKEKGLLNNEMIRKVDVIMFNYLRYKGRLSPKYAAKKIGEVTFDLPVNLQLRKKLVLLNFKILSVRSKLGIINKSLI
jgi:glycosyltransferase involved in cell wall biosynthesis